MTEKKLAKVMEKETKILKTAENVAFALFTLYEKKKTIKI